MLTQHSITIFSSPTLMYYSLGIDPGTKSMGIAGVFKERSNDKEIVDFVDSIKPYKKYNYLVRTQVISRYIYQTLLDNIIDTMEEKIKTIICSSHDEDYIDDGMMESTLIIAIERPPMVFKKRNPETYRKLAIVEGAIISAVTNYIDWLKTAPGVPYAPKLRIVSFNNTKAKKIVTGRGDSSKIDVAGRMRMLYGDRIRTIKDISKMNKAAKKRYFDQCDALMYATAGMSPRVLDRNDPTDLCFEI